MMKNIHRIEMKKPGQHHCPGIFTPQGMGGGGGGGGGGIGGTWPVSPPSPSVVVVTTCTSGQCFVAGLWFGFWQKIDQIKNMIPDI